MTDHAVAHVDEIEEASDGRCPWRPVRHHFGITAFGVSTWTGREAGDRILEEDDELTREPGHLRAERLEDERTRTSTSFIGAAHASSSTVTRWTRPPARSSSSRPA